MLRIRLIRVGRKNDPKFRLVVLPQRTPPKTGKFLEMLGFYNPVKHVRNFNKERILYWLSKGAQASSTVRNMLISAGIVEGKKVAVHKKSKKKEPPATSAASADKGGIQAVDSQA